jgi:hypothetical protein
MNAPPPVAAPAERRFAVRFLGRWNFWAVLAVTGVLAAAAAACERFGTAGEWQRGSGFGLLALFAAAYAFSLRKWSMKLRAVREYGMWSAAARSDLRRSRRDDRFELARKRRADLAGASPFTRAGLVKIVRRWRADRRELAKRDARHRQRLAAAIHADLDHMWTGLNEINRKIAAKQLVTDGDILRQANQVVATARVRGIRRVDLVEQAAPTGEKLRAVVARHREPFGRLEAWLEVHAALGTVAALGVLPHARWSVDSSLGAWMTGLSLLVLLSGAAGLVLFRLAPAWLAKHDFGIPFEEAGTLLADWSVALAAVERRLPEATRGRIARFLGGGDVAPRGGEIKALLAAEPREAAAAARDVLVLAGTRAALRRATLPSRRVDLLLHAWRWVHVPASVVLLALVVVHLLQVRWF